MIIKLSPISTTWAIFDNILRFCPVLCLVTMLLFESLGLSLWVASSKRKRSALLNDSVVPSYSLIAVDPPQYKEDINFSQDCIDEDETVRDNEAAPGKQSHISILNSLISLDRRRDQTPVDDACKNRRRQKLFKTVLKFHWNRMMIS